MLDKSNQFQPVKDEHAIERVALVLNLSRQLNAEDVKRLIERHEDWKEVMPGLTKIQAGQVSLGFNIQLGNPTPQELVGAEFKRANPDGSLEWHMRAEGNAIILICGQYSRWKSVWETTRAVFEKVCNAILVDRSDLSLSGCALEYVDRFVWDGEESDIEPSALFNPESEFISEAAMSFGPIWHSHTGWFYFDSLHLGGQRLEKINIDSRRHDEGFFDSTIVCSMTHTFDSTVNEITNFFTFNDGEDYADIDRCMYAMHERNKEILRSMLQPEIAERISLNAAPQ